MIFHVQFLDQIEALQVILLLRLATERRNACW